MATIFWQHRNVFSFLLIAFGVLQLVHGKPEIEGPKQITAQIGDDVAIKCYANDSITWYRFNNSTFKSENIDEETGNHHFSLDFPLSPDYTDWPDAPKHRTEEFAAVIYIFGVEESDAGVYLCMYEEESKDIRYNKVKNSDKEFFSSVTLDVKVVKPIIDIGEKVVVPAGESINMTCSGEKPVTWVFLNNHTWGVQHTENKTVGYMRYFSSLEITNVNYTDVGYLVCKFADEETVLYDDFGHEEDHRSSSIYLFVKDVNHLLVPSDFHEINVQLGSEVVVPCKPTFPDVEVELRALDNSKVENTYLQIYNARSARTGVKIFSHFPSIRNLLCYASYQNNSESITYKVKFYNPVLSSVNLTVTGAWQTNSLEEKVYTFDVIAGDVVLINCSTQHPRNLATIMWQTPHSREKSSHQIRRYDYPGTFMDSRLIPDVSMETDSGVYSCYVTNNHLNSSAFVFALNVFSPESSHLNLKAQNEKVLLSKGKNYPQTLKWIIFFRAYPALYLKWIMNGETKMAYVIGEKDIDHVRPMIKRKEQYEIKINWAEGEIILRIYNPSIHDTGIYILSAEVPGKETFKEKLNLSFFKEGPPQDVHTEIGPRLFSKKERTKISVECSAYGYPFPLLKILFKSCKTLKDCEKSHYVDIEASQLNNETIVNSTSENKISGKNSVKWIGVAKTQGYYLCLATNIFGSQNSLGNLLLISDSEFGDADILQIEIMRNEHSFVAKKRESFIEGDTVEFSCRGNTFAVSSPLSWIARTNNNTSFLLEPETSPFQGSDFTLSDTSTRYSHISRIKTRMTQEMNGISLICLDSSMKALNCSVNVTVIDASAPAWLSEPLKGLHYVKNENEKLNLECAGNGIPKPAVTWFKNGKEILPENDDRRISIYDGHLSIEFLFLEDAGEYLCRIENREGALNDYITLEVTDPHAAPHLYLIIIIAVVSALFLLLVIILTIKVYRGREADRMFKLETQKRFIEGNPESLNPDLDLGEQAELLPYDNRFEFPRDRVTIENLLGSGAFGNVFKATATDLISGASKTTVAVKMLKSSANAAQMRTLVSELKIMIHIGRHVNIVNLLGACSKNMASKGELLLIVEYCRHGSILEYMRRHKSEFLDQINDKDKIDPNMAYYRKRTYSNQRASLRPMYAQLDIHWNSKYYSSEIVGDSVEKRVSVENDCSVESAGRRRIKSDSAVSDVTVNTDMTVATSDDNYINEITLEKRGLLCSKDLLHWAYQIANGMFYLSEKKVIHGDLAARNILLADKNVVKISDFGLSKSIYKQEHYKKKSECPLPVKWLALEALRDSIFSTHSDVWSYGVVLWEIFSLGSNPFAGVEVDASFVTKLEEGLRLRHPLYATSDLYRIMMQCWERNPNNRPSFRDLEKTLGDMLGETEKQMYMTLNADYEENNIISEHLQFLHTPSYDTRIRGFFTEKDDLGYEKALVSGKPGLFMEPGACTKDDPNSTKHFELDPVPLRRKSNPSGRTQSTQEERQTLLRRNQETDYLIMTSPTDGDCQTTSVAIPKPELMGGHALPSVTYANVENLELSDASNKDRRSPYGRGLSHSRKRSPNAASVEDEGNIFTFNESGALAENDSVFSSEGFEELDEEKNDIKNRSDDDCQKNLRIRGELYHSKYDSGIYSPNILQNNPTYTTTSFITNEKAENLSNQTSQHRQTQNLKPEGNQRESVTSNVCKQRNQSDSSSGFGSLIDDRSNSLEKYKCNAKEKSLIELQKPFFERVFNFSET